jgi:hypothetical protein
MTDLMVKGSTALAAIPEHLRADLGNRDGKDGVEQGDLLVPRLKLAQALSNERKRSHESYNPDLKEGEFFNSVTGEIYGEQVTVIPLHFFNEYIEFDGDNKVVKYYQRGELPSAEDLEVVKGQKPKCTTFKCRMSLLMKEDGSIEPIVVSFKYVGRKTPTNKWNFLIAQKNLPAYAYQYRLFSDTTHNEKGEWFIGKFERADFTPAALYEQAKQYFASLQEAGVKVDVSGIEQEVVEDGDTSFDQQQ